MYVIMVYDVSEDKVSKVLKTARKYLNWIQNSVLEGEITEAKLFQLKKEISDIIEKDKDSVIFYVLPTEKNMVKDVMGILKKEQDFFI
jgi:CRISPR-associated protein Cas2